SDGGGFTDFPCDEVLFTRGKIAARDRDETGQARNHLERDIPLYRWMRLLYRRQHVDICADEFFIHIESDVLSLVIHANEHVETPAFERAGKFLPDGIFKILIFAGYFNMNVEVAMIHAFDLNQYRQVLRFCAPGSETSHAVDHGVTS